MDNLDEIFASMPEAAAEADREYLVIDPATRTITVPESEQVFGVTGDEQADRKYFLCPRYVGDGLDLAGMFVRVNFRNADGDEDGYLVDDVTVVGDYVTFSWKLWPKVTEYSGTIQFGVSADLPNTADRRFPDWNTTMATGEVLEGLHPYDGDVEEETRDVVTQLRAETAAQTAAVAACGAEQVQAVKDTAAAETADAVAAIQAQGAATQASLPADYTALAAQVDKLTRDRAAAIVCEAEGTVIQVQDASNDPLQGLRIFGRSTQDGTPTPDSPVEIVSTPAPVVTVCGKNLLPPRTGALVYAGITYTPQADGTLRASGTTPAGEDSTFYIVKKEDPITLPPGKYILSGVPGGTEKTYRLLAYSTDWTLLAETTPGREGFTLEKTTDLFIYLWVYRGQTVDVVVSPQLELGNVATAYEPYTCQPMAITTPGSLPGIPVASGGNYTDANGQEWICDEVDLARGVYVQRVGRLTLDGSAKWNVYNYETIYYGFHIWDLLAEYHSRSPGMCNQFETVGGSNGDCIWVGASNANVYAISKEWYDKGLDAWKEHLNAKPLVIIYARITPIETPLTDVELQAYLALQSYKPTTTVLNDAGAHMALEYAADPKTYIDNKLAALVAANN